MSFSTSFKTRPTFSDQLTRTIFRRSSTVLTAVGDNKQQIMRWAMAMADPFTAFERDFNATRTTLLNNYRSSPELVRIQHVLAQAIDAGSLQAVSMTPGDIAGESCEVWDFRSQELEATGVASFIAAEIAARGLRPRDFVLLVRQKAGDYVRFSSLPLPLKASCCAMRRLRSDQSACRNFSPRNSPTSSFAFFGSRRLNAQDVPGRNVLRSRRSSGHRDRER